MHKSKLHYTYLGGTMVPTLFRYLTNSASLSMIPNSDPDYDLVIKSSIPYPLVFGRERGTKIS